MNTLTLPAGTTLFRARNINDKSHCLNPNECGDTGKTGLYFSDYPLLSMGMAIEYQIDIDMYVYRVERSIELYEGKYSFRDIHPERYFKDGQMIFNVDVIEDENVNHFDSGAIPIYDNADEVHEGLPDDVLGEIFINKDDLQHLSLLRIDQLSLEDMKSTIFG